MAGGGGGIDPKVREQLGDLVSLQKSSLKWYWRAIAIIVAIATVISAVFQMLNYFCNNC